MVAPGARKYVLALLELAEESDQVEAVRGDLARLQRLVADVPGLLTLVSHPGLDSTRKREIFHQALEQQLTALVARFLDVLLADGQGEVLREAVDIYQQLVDERRGLRRAVVETALSLSADQTSRLQEALEQVVHAPVTIEERVNPQILGGLRISVGDTIMDVSVQGRLRQMLADIQQTPIEVESGALG